MAASAVTKQMGKVALNIWQLLPPKLQQWPAVRALGAGVHRLSRRFSNRGQVESTWFLRNEPLLLTIAEIVDQKFTNNEPVRLCIMGCSTGAEMFSVLWAIRKKRPDLKIVPVGVDISKSALDKARAGRYQRDDWELRGKIPDDVFSELFDVDGNELRIKGWISEGVQWVLDDARDLEIVQHLGQQDILVANNFLIHMKPREATACLDNIIQLVRPGGFFVCQGVDLEIRERAVEEFHLEPIPTRIEEIHDWDFLDLRYRWPLKYDGLEPLNKGRKDWIQRYAAVLRMPNGSKAERASMGTAKN
jgi:chemotaxis methyl-accepting protein methylase